MRHQQFILGTVTLFCATALFAQTFGTKQRMPRPDEFGNVVMNNYSEQSGIEPVEFAHWFHRSRYTCRLCHVDLGFAMKAGETGMREQDNRHGLYCGACHNGGEAFTVSEKKRLGKTEENCRRCHSVGLDIEPEHDFYEFTRDFPRARFGNKVDWLIAEEQGLIKLEDYLEGVSIRRDDLEGPHNVDIDATVTEMPDIIFSHDKHVVWNGCELCHPQIFGVKKEATVYSMQENFEGKYCGACHGSVAFTTMDCQLCHAKKVY